MFYALAPTHPFLWPTISLVLIYGIRYFIMAGALYLVARPVGEGGLGRTHERVPARFEAVAQIKRELGYAFGTLLVFGGINAVLFGWGWMEKSQIYLHISDYPVWWFWLSIPVMLMLHDTFFYWSHRAMHSRLLFAFVHKVHHRSIYPTTFTAYSFHPAEAVVDSVILISIFYLIPTHPLAFMIFQTISTAYNVYGHCGREFYPPGVANHWLGRWMNTSTAHAAHHVKGRYNYGLYFMFWDRVMHTRDPAYK